MKNETLKNLLIIVCLLGLLTFLFVQTKLSKPEKHHQMVINIQQLFYHDARLNESVLEYSADQFSNYDLITELKRSIRQNMKWFRNPEIEIYDMIGQSMHVAIDETVDNFEKKIALIERFKSHNGILKNSLFYLPTAVRDIQQDLSLRTYHSDSAKLLQEILLYNSGANEKYRVNGEIIIKQLKALNSPRLGELIMHAETVLRERSIIQSLVDASFSIPTKSNVENIYKLYNRHHENTLNVASLYRNAMYAMAVLLVFFVLYLFYTLGKTLRHLEESLYEVEFQKNALDQHAIVASIGADGITTYANDKFTQTTQYSKEEIVGKPRNILESGFHDKAYFEGMWAMLESGQCWRGEIKNKKKDGSIYWLDATVVPFIDKKGNPIRHVALLNDITEKKLNDAKQAVVQSELRLAASVFSDSPMAIAITDSSSTIIRVNKAFSRITKYSSEDAIGQSSELLKSGQHEKQFYIDMWKQLLKEGQWDGEAWCHRKNGEEFPVWANITAVYNDEGVKSHYISIFSDITEKKIGENRIFRLAHYDELTGLPNRTMFLSGLSKALIQATELNQKIAVLFIDLDNFKLINDTMGHASGDTLLRIVSNHLRSCVRASDIVARLGGDEFTIALPGIDSMSQIETIVNRILSITKVSVSLNQKDIIVSSSIGISVFPDDASDIDTLLKNADIAMYQAKANGKNNFKVFDEELKMQSSERHSMENDLLFALRNNQFILHYQPQIDTLNGEIQAVEALIRWNHPEKGMVPPNEFIPILEESGLIIDVGKWVLMEACTQLAKWKDAGFNLSMAVNVSARQLHDENLLTLLTEILQFPKIHPSNIDLELTETSLLENTDAIIHRLTKLNNMGINLSLDDFGTGYSSLSYLKKLPISKLKIDQSFVRDIPIDQHDMAIANTVIAMARSLDLKVVAEGVETTEQIDFLTENGCDLLQGYYFSKPVDADALQQLLINWNSDDNDTLLSMAL